MALSLAFALFAPTVAAADEGALLDARIRESYAAAQALQGALDGAWSLCDRAGRQLYAFEFVDPPGPHPLIEAAWRAPGNTNRSGAAEIHSSGESGLRLDFDAAAGPARIDLRPTGADWTGRLTQAGESVGVVLKRDRC